MTQDPESLHRAAIASAQKHMGDFAWGTVALVIGVAASYIGNLWLFATGALPPGSPPSCSLR